MLIGPDLATTIVRPHQFLDYLLGRTKGLFVTNRQSLDERLKGTGSKRDFDSRFPIVDFFCFEDNWVMVLRELVASSDVVFLDARGFSKSNSGVAFEIMELIKTVPLSRIFITVDGRTDTDYVCEIVEEAWMSLPEWSPNRSLEFPVLTLRRVEIGNTSEFVSVVEDMKQAASQLANVDAVCA